MSDSTITKSISSIIKDKSTYPLFTAKEAAKYLGVEENTLNVWRCTKRYSIPYIKVGRLVKYRKSALDTFLESRTRGSEV